jgi:hypothetical protein
VAGHREDTNLHPPRGDGFSQADQWIDPYGSLPDGDGSSFRGSVCVLQPGQAEA